MDACLPDWNTDVEAQFPLSLQRKPLGLENELVELLWQNGEIVLHSQTNRKQKQIRDPNSLIEDDETSLWMDCPMDESFEKDFCSNFLSDVPSLDESHKQNLFQDFAPPAPTPPRFQHHHHLPIKKQAYSRVEHEGSGMTRISHCASNQVVNEVDMSLASSSGIGSRTISAAGAGEAYAWKVSEGAEREAITSCSGGSGTSLWKTSSVCNDTNRHKRKSRDESECPSDGTESELAAGNKATRRSRVAEVHNLSERRRRDRINEKMRALQELIPHANKSDKASMLDEAIEYMKSLQLQIQFMWMARGMAPMMLPGMQHYMSRVGMGIGPPAIQPQAGHNPILSYQNQMQNSRLQEQYVNYMAFNQMHNSSPQATNMFNFGFHSAQSAPQSNGNRPVG